MIEVPKPAIELHEVYKTYGQGEVAVSALDGVSASIDTGSFTAIMGPSGSGKSTLLHCAGGLDHVTSGTVITDGYRLDHMNEADLTKARRNFGFVFQQFNLLPTLTAAENVRVPVSLAGGKMTLKEAGELLAEVGLADRSTHRPSQLSGGQQQRVAIARALAARPGIIFADEPTGALDSQTSQGVLTILARQAADFGRTVVMVTHDPMAASYADEVLFLVDGRCVDSVPSPTVNAITQRMLQLQQSADD